MKPILLGMNSKTGEALGIFPINGAGRRLFNVSGMTLEVYNTSFDRMNLLDEPEWSMSHAREAAAAIKRRLAGRTVLVLGNQAWTALSLPKVFFLSGCVSEETTWYLFPHPSGKNLWYNVSQNRERARLLLERVASGR